jgi:hypothetical protein
MSAADTPTVAARRKRLTAWIKQHCGGSRKEFVEAARSRGIKLNPTEVSNLQSGKKSFGEVKAGEYEQAAGMPPGYLVSPLHDAPSPSQPPIPDPDRLGLALTAIDRVIRERGLVMEGRLGTFSGLLSFAYLLQEDPELFPNGFVESTAAERKKYDAKVKKELGGLIRSGQVEVVGKDEAAGDQGASRR